MTTPDALLALWCLWGASVGCLTALVLIYVLRYAARG